MKKCMFAVFVSFLLLFSLSSCSILIDLNYDILDEKDVSTGDKTRYAYWVVPSEQENQRAWERIFEDLDGKKASTDQLTVFFYESADQYAAGDTYTLAKIERTEKGGKTAVEVK